MPLFKSSNIQFWPVLCSLRGFEPFIVALFCGNSKPDPVEEYLHDFIQELQMLCNEGITFNNRRFRVEIEAFICDDPARCFVKCIKGHNGYYYCERCTVKGTWDGRVVFNSEDRCPLRNDQDFVDKRYEMHQINRSPLVDLGISCISGFSLDYMHLVCLGLVKRLLHFLTKGPNTCRLSLRQRTNISERLTALNGLMPREFARQPRSLPELERWKATEFRQFLLYTGPVVLRHVVPESVYEHYLCLTVGLSVMLDSDQDKREAYLTYSQQIIEYFVHKCKDVYGHTFTVYNVHNLLHLHEDVQFFKCSLNDVSSFKFENHMQIVKKLVRKSHNPIAQVAKRMIEIESSGLKKHKRVTSTFISRRKKDNCILLQTEEYAFVREQRENGQLYCEIISSRYTENFFIAPCECKLLNIVYIRNILMKTRTKHRLLMRTYLSRKVVCLPYGEGCVLFPMLHGAEQV